MNVESIRESAGGGPRCSGGLPRSGCRGAAGPPRVAEGENRADRWRLVRTDDSCRDTSTLCNTFSVLLSWLSGVEKWIELILGKAISGWLRPFAERMSRLSVPVSFHLEPGVAWTKESMTKRQFR